MRSRLVPFFLLAALLPAAELPIREVVLYKHGVGFFERAGSIPAGETARLDFKVSQMNDVLKSLIINGKSERVTGLRYDSSIPLAQTLAQFPFQIDAGAALSGVLDQLKGARLELQIGNEKTAGEIVAARVVAADKDRAERQQIVCGSVKRQAVGLYRRQCGGCTRYYRGVHHPDAHLEVDLPAAFWRG
jgi:hypothetical protein